MKDFERFVYVIIVICAIIFAVTRVPEIEIKTIPGDTVFNIITKDSLIVDTFEIYNKDTLWMYDTIIKNDTVFVYNEFFKMNKYNDTIQNDSSLTIVRDLWITQNKAYKETYFTKNNRQTTIVNQNNCPKSYITVGANLNKYSFPIMIGYEKNNNEFKFGLDIFNKNAPTVGYNHKFKLR